MEEMIKLSLPQVSGHEMKWIERAFAEDWIVPLGPNVDEFERRLSAFTGGRPVVALSSGTAAIHLALVMLGVGSGDEVICQDMTFSASANPIRYCGAKPVFVDSEAETYNIDPELLDRAIREREAATGHKPKAIIAVWLYGMPPKMDEVMAVADAHGIPVVEDSAEAMGSTYKGRAAGTFGKYGIMSFNGNKMITTSGGGALICPDEEAAARVKFYATQARENRPYYYHEHIGYNYRLSNISAGIGCGQMETVDERIARRRAIHEMYAEGLKDVKGVSVHSAPGPEYAPNYWLSTILLDTTMTVTPLQARERLLERGIETRLLWRPMTMQPVFADAPSVTNGTGAGLFERGLCLPSGSTLSDAQVERVISEIHKL
ncbi:MAG: aminotransferase class I/II-fold pyridoxal phosphate-dependent enzyme [Candidatus Amulumruptor caecigallinarius]|nr:aminotransferase class I/II-fold pyridoxal phosphate-dependent enzyme [Candidatus Amulumruptor caecigallinarius]MCM1396389.1 aminotransferase class I/II-fold pyridoxal phosphate-dependent enzyme [Candidatus Amulumruptor caecigallinarius]MCM1453554.1 aminotransferase class I/II-fold pyridoxal phosphate-dependent enzyme [bacterium]